MARRYNYERFRPGDYGFGGFPGPGPGEAVSRFEAWTPEGEVVQREDLLGQAAVPWIEPELGMPPASVGELLRATWRAGPMALWDLVKALPALVAKRQRLAEEWGSASTILARSATKPRGSPALKGRSDRMTSPPEPDPDAVDGGHNPETTSVHCPVHGP